MAEHETIADIIAEMRGFKRYASSDSSDCRYVAYWLYQTFADRLDAAHKRECGNCAKLREALEKVRHLMPYFLQYMRLRWEDAGGGGYYESINKTIEAALAATEKEGGNNAD